MSKVIEVEVFKYDELSDSAKQRARDWYLEGMDYDWYDCVYEMCIEDGKEKGFDIDKINFSGFWSQGDGASWTGSVDLLEFIEKHADKESASFGEDMILCELIRNEWVNKELHIVRRSYHYAHEYRMTILREQQ